MEQIKLSLLYNTKGKIITTNTTKKERRRAVVMVPTLDPLLRSKHLKTLYGYDTEVK